MANQGDAVMIELTRTQVRVLRAMYEHGPQRLFNSSIQTKDSLENLGLIADERKAGETWSSWKITAKGLRAIDANELDIVTREELERQRKHIALKLASEREENALKREAERKAKIIAKVRNALPTAFGPEYAHDGVLWNLITRIVEIHEGTT